MRDIDDLEWYKRKATELIASAEAADREKDTKAAVDAAYAVRLAEGSTIDPSRYDRTERRRRAQKSVVQTPALMTPGEPKPIAANSAHDSRSDVSLRSPSLVAPFSDDHSAPSTSSSSLSLDDEKNGQEQQQAEPTDREELIAYLAASARTAEELKRALGRRGVMIGRRKAQGLMKRNG